MWSNKIQQRNIYSKLGHFKSHYKQTKGWQKMINCLLDHWDTKCELASFFLKMCCIVTWIIFWNRSFTTQTMNQLQVIASFFLFAVVLHTTLLWCTSWSTSPKNSPENMIQLIKLVYFMVWCRNGFLLYRILIWLLMPCATEGPFTETDCFLFVLSVLSCGNSYLFFSLTGYAGVESSLTAWQKEPEALR